VVSTAVDIAVSASWPVYAWLVSCNPSPWLSTPLCETEQALLRPTKTV